MADRPGPTRRAAAAASRQRQGQGPASGRPGTARGTGRPAGKAGPAPARPPAAGPPTRRPAGDRPAGGPIRPRSGRRDRHGPAGRHGRAGSTVRPTATGRARSRPDPRPGGRRGDRRRLDRGRGARRGPDRPPDRRGRGDPAARRRPGRATAARRGAPVRRAAEIGAAPTDATRPPDRGTTVAPESGGRTADRATAAGPPSRSAAVATGAPTGPAADRRRGRGPGRPATRAWPRRPRSLPPPDLLGPTRSSSPAGVRSRRSSPPAGRRIRLLVVPHRRNALEQLVLHATRLRIPIVEVEGGSLTAIAGFDGHQGVALVVEPRQFATLDDILARAADRGEPPFVLVLDSLEDPQNLGTLLRSAEAAGVHGVLFPTRRQAPLSAAAVKASAGATEHLLLCPVDDLPGALADLHVRGLRIAGSEADAPLTARQTDLRGPLAIVVGSEGQGLGPAIRRRCDTFMRIPMRGAIGSLNAAVAGSVLLFEAVAQRDPTAGARAAARRRRPPASRIAHAAEPDAEPADAAPSDRAAGADRRAEPSATDASRRDRRSRARRRRPERRAAADGARRRPPARAAPAAARPPTPRSPSRRAPPDA